MARKTFEFKVTGKSFNLETFAIEEKTFFTQKNDIVFRSKQEFIECINHAIESFYKGMMDFLEEGTPDITVEYKNNTAKLMFFNIKDGNSFCISSNKLNIRNKIFELVQTTEAELAKIQKRAADAYEDLPVSLQR